MALYTFALYLCKTTYTLSYRLILTCILQNSPLLKRLRQHLMFWSHTRWLRNDRMLAHRQWSVCDVSPITTQNRTDVSQMIHLPTAIIRWINVGLMLARLRRWINLKPTLTQRLVSDVVYHWLVSFDWIAPPVSGRSRFAFSLLCCDLGHPITALNLKQKRLFYRDWNTMCTVWAINF